MNVVITGHRPERLFVRADNPYSISCYNMLVEFYKHELTWRFPGANTLVSGMALGADQAALDAALRLGWDGIAVVPFEKQAAVWKDHATLVRYNALLLACKKTDILPGNPKSRNEAVRLLYLRNEVMIRSYADVVLALWDGSPSGTGHTVAYAHKRDIPAYNCWDAWIKWRSR